MTSARVDGGAVTFLVRDPGHQGFVAEVLEGRVVPSDRPGPVVLTCGAIEENLSHNRPVEQTR